MKFTFKKHPRATGLAAVGYGRQSVDIRLAGKNIGLIRGPDWTTPDHCYSIGVQVKGNPDNNPNCSWHWVYFKVRFATEDVAREWVTTRLEAALLKNNLVLAPQEI